MTNKFKCYQVLLLLVAVFSVATYSCSKSGKKEPLTLAEKMARDPDVKRYFAEFAMATTQTYLEFDKLKSAEQSIAEIKQAGRYESVAALAKKIQGKYHLTEASRVDLANAMELVQGDKKDFVTMTSKVNKGAREMDYQPEQPPIEFEPSPLVYPMDPMQEEFERAINQGCKDWFMVSYSNGTPISETYVTTTCPPPGFGGTPFTPEPTYDTTGKKAMCLEKLAFEKNKCWKTKVWAWVGEALTLIITEGAGIGAVAGVEYISLMTYLDCITNAHDSFKLCMKY